MVSVPRVLIKSGVRSYAVGNWWDNLLFDVYIDPCLRRFANDPFGYVYIAFDEESYARIEREVLLKLKIEFTGKEEGYFFVRSLSFSRKSSLQTCC